MRASSHLRMLVLCAVLLAVAQARADFKQSYARGKEAAADGRWSEVEARMREAIAEEPQAQSRVRIYGMRFETYVPQYYLGLAAFRQGNCAAALQNWQDPSAASIVAAEPMLQGVVNDGRAECKRKADASVALAKPAQPQASSPPPVSTPPPRPAVAQPLATKPPAASTAAPPAVASTPAKPAAGLAPAALVGALEGFIAGRFEQTANLDMGAFGANSRARFHALLLRSAARHTLAQVGGDRADALLAGAQADVRAAKALVPGAMPDSSVFSPRFRKLFDDTR